MKAIRWKWRKDAGGLWCAEVDGVVVVAERSGDGGWNARSQLGKAYVRCLASSRATAARGALAAALAMRGDR